MNNMFRDSLKNKSGGSMKLRIRKHGSLNLSISWIFLICISSFFLGTLFSNQGWISNTTNSISRRRQEGELHFISNDCTTNRKLGKDDSILRKVHRTHEVIQSLDKSMYTLQQELATSRDSYDRYEGVRSLSTSYLTSSENDLPKRKVFVVIGINTAFSSRRRRDSIRQTWMPQGERLAQLEERKSIVVRFMIGRSMTPNSILDRAIDSEDAQHKDFLRLDHVEGYHELSAKTKIFFSTAVSIWNAEFYVKVDDDIHVNLGMLAEGLSRHRSKRMVYMGCMKSGPVLSQKTVKYYEPEYWKFGDMGNKYFRHATGQIYAISRDLATYIAQNRPILHKYANEDVSLGAWFIGLEVEHIDQRSMCCSTPPDCEWKAQGGSACIASFDWSCSGICKSVERIFEVHERCSEAETAVWEAHI